MLKFGIKRKWAKILIAPLVVGVSADLIFFLNNEWDFVMAFFIVSAQVAGVWLACVIAEDYGWMS